jgi:trigger factor
MQVSVRDGEGMERRIDVVLPAETFQQEMDARARRLSRTARLKGFRPGKVPLDVVRKSFGDQIRSEAIQGLLSNSYQQAVTELKLNTVGDPRIESLRADPSVDFAYTAVVEIMPQISIQPLTGLMLDRYKAEVSDADVDNMLETMRKQRAEFSPVERASADGDRLTVDFEGLIGGEKFEGGTASDVKFVLGRKQMLADFEYGLKDAKAGDQKNIMVQFPEDYGNVELAGKTAFFDVTIKEVAESVLPELNDQFCEAFGVEGGIAALREEVRASMTNELDNAIRTRLRNQVMEKVLEANPIELPKQLVAEALAEIREEVTRRTGVRDAEQLPINDQLLPQAKRRAALRLLLAELAREADLKLDRTKVQEMLSNLVEGTENPDELRRQYLQNADLMARIESSVLEDQLIDWIVSQAIVMDIESSFSDITLFGKGPTA